jgi:hypothetical protein
MPAQWILSGLGPFMPVSTKILANLEPSHYLRFSPVAILRLTGDGHEPGDDAECRRFSQPPWLLALSVFFKVELLP